MRTLTEAEMANAMQAHPLPPGAAEGVFSLVEMADLLSVSLPTMQKYLRKGMPSVQRGGQGCQWQIRLSAAWAWLGFFKELKQQKNERSERIASVIASQRATRRAALKT